MIDPYDDVPVLASIDARLLHLERQISRIERRSLVRLRQNYGIYAVLTLIVATLIVAGLQRLGDASAEVLTTMYKADAVACALVWVMVFLRPLFGTRRIPITVVRTPAAPGQTPDAGADDAG